MRCLCIAKTTSSRVRSGCCSTDAGFRERRDLRREVVTEGGELPRIDDGEAGILDRRNERVMPGRIVLRGIKQRADNLVGLLLLPEADETSKHLIEAPEEMVSPGKAVLRGLRP